MFAQEALIEDCVLLSSILPGDYLPEIRGEFKLVTHIIPSPPEVRSVYCDKDALVPGLFCSPHQRQGQIAVFVDV